MHAGRCVLQAACLPFMTKLPYVPSLCRYSVGYVFTDGIKAVELQSVVSEVIVLLEAAGLQVAYTVCDGASENRAWMKMMADRDLAVQLAKGAVSCSDGASHVLLASGATNF